MGFIPLENIESPFARLARLNKHRNIDFASATDVDRHRVLDGTPGTHLRKRREHRMGVHAAAGKISALSRRLQGVQPPALASGHKKSVEFGTSTVLEFNDCGQDSVETRGDRKTVSGDYGELLPSEDDLSTDEEGSPDTSFDEWYTEHLLAGGQEAEPETFCSEPTPQDVRATVPPQCEDVQLATIDGPDQDGRLCIVPGMLHNVFGNGNEYSRLAVVRNNSRPKPRSRHHLCKLFDATVLMGGLTTQTHDKMAGINTVASVFIGCTNIGDVLVASARLSYRWDVEVLGHESVNIH